MDEFLGNRLNECRDDANDRESRADSRAGRRRSGGLAALLLAFVLVGATPAAADEYDEEWAGHPLRIVAYIVHPVGVVLEYVIYRPVHWLGSHEPLKTLFGHTD